MREPWYTTREAVKAALDVKATARSDGQIDDAIEAASREVERALHRKFYPWTGTRYFSWPARPGSVSWRLWLGKDELISATQVTSGGVAISASDYFLEPANSGPPYTSIELDKDSTASFGRGTTDQRDIAVTGVFGYCSLSSPAGATTEALDSSETAVDVSDSTSIGVGDLILVESERMIVTGKSMLTTGQTLQADLGSASGTVSVSVTTGSAYTVGEVVLIDAERMLIVDIAGNTLVVKRAWDGSVLGAHTAGVTIYAPRTLTVERGSVGTTAAAHSSGVAVAVHEPPGPVRALCKALALEQFLQEGSGYGRTVGSGDSERESAGKGLAGAWKRVEPYRRQRQGAV